MSDDPRPRLPAGSPESTPASPDGGSIAPSLPRRPGQWIAEASWISCGLAIILTLIANALHLQNGAAATGVVIGMLALLGLGLLLSIIALSGMRRWRNPGILRPAGVGLILSIALLALMARSRHQQTLERQRLVEVEREKLLTERRRLAEVERDAFLDSGWLGVAQLDEINLILTSTPRQSPLHAGMQEKLGADLSVVLLRAQNLGKAHGSVDTSGAVVTLNDGTQVTALDAVTLLQNARSDREELMRAYSPPLAIPPSIGGSTLFLFPPTVDWSQVQSLTLRVNGQSHVIAGSFVTKEEKRRLMTAASQPASQAL